MRNSLNYIFGMLRFLPVIFSLEADVVQCDGLPDTPPHHPLVHAHARMCTCLQVSWADSATGICLSLYIVYEGMTSVWEARQQFVAHLEGDEGLRLVSQSYAQTTAAILVSFVLYRTYYTHR